MTRPPKSSGAAVLFSIVLVTSAFGQNTGRKPVTSAAKAPKSQIEYVIEDLDKTDDPAILFGVLRAKVNGRKYDLVDRSKLMRLNVLKVMDFDGNGYDDALVSAWVGNCCPITLIMVFAYPGGRFKVDEDFADTWFDAQIEKWRGRWSVFVTSSNEGYNNNAPERVDRRFVFENGKAVQVEEIRHENIKSLAEKRSEEFDIHGGDQQDTLEFDLDGDGRDDIITLNFWPRWGRMRWFVKFANGKEVEGPGECKRVGILATKTQSVNDIVCDQDMVVRWNGRTWR